MASKPTCKEGFLVPIINRHSVDTILLIVPNLFPSSKSSIICISNFWAGLSNSINKTSFKNLVSVPAVAWDCIWKSLNAVSELIPCSIQPLIASGVLYNFNNLLVIRALFNSAAHTFAYGTVTPQTNLAGILTGQNVNFNQYFLQKELLNIFHQINRPRNQTHCDANIPHHTVSHIHSQGLP